jgi:hypothetical protein
MKAFRHHFFPPRFGAPARRLVLLLIQDLLRIQRRKEMHDTRNNPGHYDLIKTFAEWIDFKSPLAPPFD